MGKREKLFLQFEVSFMYLEFVVNYFRKVDLCFLVVALEICFTDHFLPEIVSIYVRHAYTICLYLYV